MKTKIVLDSDVIIHFYRGGSLNLLFDIFTEYEYVILDVVYDEVKNNRNIKTALDNLEVYFKKLKKIKFAPAGNSIRDYSKLLFDKGRGESACLIYCRDNHDVIGSSNFKDIGKYCDEHGITYLTTLDFLYYAFIRKKLTAGECNQFVENVKAKGSILPNGFNVENYICGTIV